MSVTDRTVRRVIWRRPRAAAIEPVGAADDAAAVRQPLEPPTLVGEASVEIAPNDPLVAYFQGAVGAVELANLDLDSAALAELRAAGVTLVVPLITTVS